MLEGFAAFWAAYPRKQAKKAASLAWRRLAPDEALQGVMLAAIEKQRHCRQWRDRAFIPHPASWLNGRRWQDETADGDDTPLYSLLDQFKDLKELKCQAPTTNGRPTTPPSSA